MCFGCSKEPSYRDGLFEYPQHIFWLRNKKNNFQLRTLIWGPVSDCGNVQADLNVRCAHMPTYTLCWIPAHIFNFISVVFMVIGFIIMATQFDDYHSSLSPDWSMWLAIVGCILAFISGVMCVIDLNR